MDPSLAPYQAQHHALRRLARQQESLLAPAVVRAHPETCLDHAQRLVAELKAHLAMEDAVLYPALLGGTDADAQAQVQDLAVGRESLKLRVRDYRRSWASSELIGQAPEAFIQASADLLRSLRGCLEAEESRLYPLVDRA